jgi:hypothetical protein
MTTEERKSPFRAMLNAFDPKQAAAEDRERTRLYEAFGVKPPFPAKSWVISRMMNHYGQEYRDAEKRLLRLGKRLGRAAATRGPQPDRGSENG